MNNTDTTTQARLATYKAAQEAFFAATDAWEAAGYNTSGPEQAACRLAKTAMKDARIAWSQS